MTGSVLLRGDLPRKWEGEEEEGCYEGDMAACEAGEEKKGRRKNDVARSSASSTDVPTGKKRIRIQRRRRRGEPPPPAPLPSLLFFPAWINCARFWRQDMSLSPTKLQRRKGDWLGSLTSSSPQRELLSHGCSWSHSKDLFLAVSPESPYIFNRS